MREPVAGGSAFDYLSGEGKPVDDGAAQRRVNVYIQPDNGSLLAIAERSAARSTPERQLGARAAPSFM